MEESWAGNPAVDKAWAGNAANFAAVAFANPAGAAMGDPGGGAYNVQRGAVRSPANYTVASTLPAISGG